MLGTLQSNYSIIRVTLNTKLDSLWFVKVGSPMEGLTKSMIPLLKAEFLELFLELVL